MVGIKDSLGSLIMVLLRLMINKNADGLLTLICESFLGASYSVTVEGGRRGWVKLAPLSKTCKDC